MKKTFTLFLILSSIIINTGLLMAQSQPYGKVDVADLELKQCDFEKDANAMVLFDKANVYFDDSFNIIMDRHKRIKIFNDKGKNEANIRLEYYGANRYEDIMDLQAETINLVDGKPVITKVEKKLIYTEKIDRSSLALTFAFPNVKAGSIIELKYRWQTVSYNLPTWMFQSEIPERYNELVTEIPDLLYYKTKIRTRQPYSKVTQTTDSKNIGSGSSATAYSVDISCKALANVPSLQDEAFMSSMADNLQCISYQLTSVRPIGGFVQNFDDTWKKVGDNVVADEDFGSQFRRKLTGEEVIISKAKSLKTNNEKIAYLFNEVKTRMKWDEANRWYTVDGTSKAWDNKSGNCTEINIILYHLLKQSGVNSYPMLVSTRNHGKVNPAYPFLRQFNRTVVYIPIDSTANYILDATGKNNVYNEAPSELLNSYGLSINKEAKEYDMIFLKREQPVRQVVIIKADVKADGKMDGTAEVSSFSYHRLKSVERYKKDGEEKYKTYLKDNDENMNIATLKLQNMEVDTLPLIQSMDFKLALTGSDGDYIYFNPNLFSSLRSNPFLNEKRSSDIDFGYLNNYSVIGSYKIPVGYKIDAIPKNVTMSMPDKSINFKRILSNEDGTVQVYYTVSYKKSIFFKENYDEIREFYKKMYEMLNEQVVLKKG